MSFENGVFIPAEGAEGGAGGMVRVENQRRGGRGGRGHRGRQRGGGRFVFNPDAPAFQPSSLMPGASNGRQHAGHEKRGAFFASRRGGMGWTDNQNSPREVGIRLMDEDGLRNNSYNSVPAGSSKPDVRNQRERLTDQLTRNGYDCMICVERVKWNHPVWGCEKCYNVFHFKCVLQWAKSSLTDDGWRCPGCQSHYVAIPREYRCFCGKVKNPVSAKADTPHSCGQSCGKRGSGGPDCQHQCRTMCHPGPCPICETIETRKCCCGKTSAQVKCGSKSIITCQNVCGKVLNCGVHQCSKTCHADHCDECGVIMEMECYCGCERKEALCDSTTSGQSRYSCSRNCDKLLTCGKHRCSEKCHGGLCRPCQLSLEVLRFCPCGQTQISEACRKRNLPLRVLCTDPIPECGKVCRKTLKCGPSTDKHRCDTLCHISPICPPCRLNTPVSCRCGSRTVEIPCASFDSQGAYECEKRCTKKRSCGRHKCNTKCCTDLQHICLLVCNRALPCGNHNCDMLCHSGNCRPCTVASFNELSCECGATVIHPPIPCGTKPPACPKVCGRTHSCEHPVMHNCHSDPECPLCTMLTEKWCYGMHEKRKNVPCHITDLSCGMPCRKPLLCGRHLCPRICHPSLCLENGRPCQLGCTLPRKDCGHECGAPCHDGPCPTLKCVIVCEVTCTCLRKKDVMQCWKREKEYDRLVCYLTNVELKKVRDGTSNKEDFDEVKQKMVILELITAKTLKPSVLECDKECARIERNRKMMEALQVEDEDVTATFGIPSYSEFLTAFTKKNPQVAEYVHSRLSDLVVKANRSSKKNETYGFEPMNRDKRRFVHEYSDHFGCLSESFDEEPNRNVVCTASKGKSHIPTVSLVDAVFRPSARSERKGTFSDVEIIQNTKSQILPPANGKIAWGKGTYLQASAESSQTANTASGHVAIIRPATRSSNAVIPGPDFPPLS